MFTVPERYRASFSATMITDSSGELQPEIVENLAAKMPPPVRGAAEPQPLSAL
jgi:hypothetical protein